MSGKLLKPALWNHQRRSKTRQMQAVSTAAIISYYSHWGKWNSVGTFSLPCKMEGCSIYPIHCNASFTCIENVESVKRFCTLFMDADRFHRFHCFDLDMGWWMFCQIECRCRHEKTCTLSARNDSSFLLLLPAGDGHWEPGGRQPEPAGWPQAGLQAHRWPSSRHRGRDGERWQRGPHQQVLVLTPPSRIKERDTTEILNTRGTG